MGRTPQPSAAQKIMGPNHLVHLVVVSSAGHFNEPGGGTESEAHSWSGLLPPLTHGETPGAKGFWMSPGWEPSWPVLQPYSYLTGCTVSAHLRGTLPRARLPLLCSFLSPPWWPGNQAAEPRTSSQRRLSLRMAADTLAPEMGVPGCSLPELHLKEITRAMSPGREGAGLCSRCHDRLWGTHKESSEKLLEQTKASSNTPGTPTDQEQKHQGARDHCWESDAAHSSRET